MCKQKLIPVIFLSGSTEPQFTLERAERNLTSNINRFSVISDNGEEVEYAMVNKSEYFSLLSTIQLPPLIVHVGPARTSRARSPPTPPPPYSSDKPEVSETEEPVEIAPAMVIIIMLMCINYVMHALIIIPGLCG